MANRGTGRDTTVPCNNPLWCWHWDPSWNAAAITEDCVIPSLVTLMRGNLFLWYQLTKSRMFSKPGHKGFYLAVGKFPLWGCFWGNLSFDFLGQIKWSKLMSWVLRLRLSPAQVHLQVTCSYFFMKSELSVGGAQQRGIWINDEIN